MPVWAALPFVLLPEVRRQIARNVARIVGPAPRAVGAARAYRVLFGFARSLAQSYAVHAGRPLELTPEIDGGEHLRVALAAGRGAVVATGHLGPWQLGPYLLEQAGHGRVVLAMAPEPDRDAQQFEQAHALRGRFRVVQVGGPLSSLALLRALRAGDTVALQMDRVPPGSRDTTLKLPFAGAFARFSVGPAALARAASAPLVPVFLLASGARRVVVHVGEAVTVPRTADRASDLRVATQALVRAYEKCVRADPYQWYSFHDFWSTA
jgi:predicted LPLAT superfamily acyltransferase